MQRLEQFATIVITAAAVAVAATFVANSFRTVPRGQAGAAPAVPAAPRPVTEWAEFVQNAHTVFEAQNGLDTIVVLFDLECPACAGYHGVLKELKETHAGGVVIKYASYPLDYHPYAMPAGNILECIADRQQSVASWVNTVMNEQRFLGLKSWSDFAVSAQVLDSATVSDCASMSEAHPRIKKVRSLADAIKISGTPTVLINGFAYSHVPLAAELDSILGANRK